MSLSQDKCARLAEIFLRPLLDQMAEIPAAEWAYLLPHLGTVSLSRGQRFSEYGQVASRFGIVVKGILCKRHLTEDGGGFVRGFAAEGELVGAYVSILTKGPSDLSVEALEDSEVLVIPSALLEILFARHVCWERIGRRIAEMFLVEREQRASEVLTSTATERYLNFRKTQSRLIGRIKEADLASYLGITAVSLSRIKAQLREKELV